jgi:hypothetical protein
MSPTAPVIAATGPGKIGAAATIMSEAALTISETPKSIEFSL